MLIQGREFVVHIQRYIKYITERFCLLYNLVRICYIYMRQNTTLLQSCETTKLYTSVTERVGPTIQVMQQTSEFLQLQH